MSHIVFVESNTTGTGRLAVERLLAEGHRVTFLTRAREKYPFLEDGRANLFVRTMETNRTGAVVAALRRLQRRVPVDALLTFSDFYVPVVAQAAARLGLRGLDPRAAATCRNKHATRRALRAARLPTPDFQLVASERQAREAGERIGFPCVVKPPADSSSHGVRRVDTPEELLEHYRLISSWSHNVRGQRLRGEVLVEEFLDGREFSVETFTIPGQETHVIGVTDKHLSPPPHFVELGHDFPSGETQSVQRALAYAAVRALAAVGFDFGPAHTEIRWTSVGPVVIEINPRLAGGMIPELVSLATGVDLASSWIRLVLGQKVDVTARSRGFASIRFLTAPRAGRLAGVAGAEEAWRTDGLRELVVSTEVGKHVRPAEDAYDRLGHVMAVGRSAVAASEAVLRARRAVDILVESEACPAWEAA